MTTKKVFSATDAHPTVLHAKRDADSEIAHPVLVGSDGGLIIGGGLVPAVYDYVELLPAGEPPTTVNFKTGGSGGTLVGTLTITYSSGKIATVTRT